MEELMSMVRLPLSYLEKYPHQLSGGEQQRAGLCRAMSLRPPLLLMDEPFASLDYGTKHGIYDHLLDIQKKESRTILIVTHGIRTAAVINVGTATLAAFIGAGGLGEFIVTIPKVAKRILICSAIG